MVVQRNLESGVINECQGLTPFVTTILQFTMRCCGAGERIGGPGRLLTLRAGPESDPDAWLNDGLMLGVG